MRATLTPIANADADSMHMHRALQLARRALGQTRPNPVVGCVIVDSDGLVVGEGFHPKAGEPHAEVNTVLCTRSLKQDKCKAAKIIVKTKKTSYYYWLL